MADEDTQLKGGHPPAVKAGGMRVTQNKPPKTGDETMKEPVTSEADADEEQQLAPKQKGPALVVAGFETQGDKDFPTAAVKSYHEKPVATHDKRPAHSPMKQQINQPRKQ